MAGQEIFVQCAVRKKPVPLHPEEKVRQTLILQMTELLGYPSSLLVVEKELSLLPHLKFSKDKFPERRLDILCFGKGNHPDFSLFPLLLIECKAVPITPKVISQAAGYNYFVKAPFVCIANQDEIRTGWWNCQKEGYQFIPFLPKYEELESFAKEEKSQSHR